MGIFRLLLARTDKPEPPRVVAEHVAPGWLKQRGYEIARSLGDEAALWTPHGHDGTALTLHCRSGHTLAIVTP